MDAWFEQALAELSEWSGSIFSGDVPSRSTRANIEKMVNDFVGLLEYRYLNRTMVRSAVIAVIQEVLDPTEMSRTAEFNWISDEYGQTNVMVFAALLLLANPDDYYYIHRERSP